MSAGKVVDLDQARERRQRVPQALTLEEVMALPPPRWLVPELLPAHGIAVLHGEPAAGKTFLALDLAMHVARGIGWAGRSVQQGGVLYVAGEGVAGLGVRMRAIVKAQGYDPTTRLRIVPAAVNVPADVSALIEEIRRIEGEAGWSVGMVILDTLARTAGGLDENSSEMARYIDACDQLAAAIRGLVLVLHHPGKDAGRGMRGWSGIRGAIDAEIEVAAGQDGVRTATWRKQKDGAVPPPLGYRLQVVETGEKDAGGAPVTSCVVEMADALPVKPHWRPRGDKQHLLWGLLGEMLKTSSHFGQAGAPAGRPCVRAEDLTTRWRAAASGEVGEKGKLLRVLGPMVTAGVIAMQNDWLWTP